MSPRPLGWLGLAWLAAGCVESGTIPCGDARCPADYLCLDEVCVAPGTACGNHYIDLPLEEVCDDGNQLDGDGCSADCRSTETCGNDRVDALAATPEACECHGSDCTVAGEVCVAYGADFGLLTCGAPTTADACQLAFGACETFGFRQRASSDAIRVRVHGDGVIVLDRLGQLAIYTDATPQPVPAIAPDVAIVDFALVGDVVYAAGTDRAVYRWTVGAPAFEPPLFQLAVGVDQLEAMAVDPATTDLVIRTSRGNVLVKRGVGAAWTDRGMLSAVVAGVAGSRDALFMIHLQELYRLDPVAAPDPWVPVPVNLPPTEAIVDAARVGSSTWIITTYSRVLEVAAGGAVTGQLPPFFTIDTPLRFLPGAGVVVVADGALAEWNGAAWHLVEPALFAPVRDGEQVGGLQVIADARGLQVRQARSWRTATPGVLSVVDATTGPDPTAGFPRLYIAAGSVAASYDGVSITTLDDGGIVPAIPIQPAPVDTVRSVCGFANGDYVVASVDELVTCATAGCQPRVPGPTGETVRVRCAVGPRWAWVVYTDIVGRSGLVRFDATTETLAALPAVDSVDEINAVATVTTTPMPATTTTIAVGRDAQVAMVWTITGPDQVVADQHPELADLMAVHACGGGDWLAGGVTIDGHAAVIRHRLGGEDLIQLPLAQPIVALTGACDRFYAATRTDLVYVAGGAGPGGEVVPLRWPFLETLAGLSVDDRGTAAPEDDLVLVGARSSIRMLR